MVSSLALFLNDFIENAELIFQVFFKIHCIHQCTTINMLAGKLNVTPEETERWGCKFARNVKLMLRLILELWVTMQSHPIRDSKDQKYFT